MGAIDVEPGSRVSHVGPRGVVWLSSGDAPQLLVAVLRDVSEDEESRLADLVGLSSPVWGLASVTRLSDGNVQVTSPVRNVISLRQYVRSHGKVEVTQLCKELVLPRDLRDASVPPSAQVMLDGAGNAYVAAVPWLQNPELQSEVSFLGADIEDYLDAHVFKEKAGRPPSLTGSATLAPTQHNYSGAKRKRRDATFPLPNEDVIPELDETLPPTAPTPRIGVAKPRWAQLLTVTIVTIVLVAVWFGWRWQETAAPTCPGPTKAKAELNRLLEIRASGLMLADPETLALGETGQILASDTRLINELVQQSTQLTDISFTSVGIADLRCDAIGWTANTIIEQNSYTRCGKNGCVQEAAEKLHLRVSVIRVGNDWTLSEASAVTGED